MSFKEEFEEWCAGDQTEPFEWHGHFGPDESHVYMTPGHKPAPKPTAWQRLWRSPWTYLLFSLYFGYLAYVHHVWYLTTLYVIITVLSFWDFLNKADKRWGRP